ncbi:hypothetical protein BGZ83_006939 [Gryganskiella cystojenkinii]|nr:hypothetical protein BGZ83_006939 [Gryganskiella cystojenkinii]
MASLRTFANATAVIQSIFLATTTVIIPVITTALPVKVVMTKLPEPIKVTDRAVTSNIKIPTATPSFPRPPPKLTTVIPAPLPVTTMIPAPLPVTTLIPASLPATTVIPEPRPFKWWAASSPPDFVLPSALADVVLTSTTIVKVAPPAFTAPVVTVIPPTKVKPLLEDDDDDYEDDEDDDDEDDEEDEDDLDNIQSNSPPALSGSRRIADAEKKEIESDDDEDDDVEEEDTPRLISKSQWHKDTKKDNSLEKRRFEQAESHVEQDVIENDDPRSALNQWIDDKVDQQSEIYEVQIQDIIERLLQEAVESFQAPTSSVAEGRNLYQQEEEIQSDTTTNKMDSLSTDPEANKAPISILSVVESLSRPLILTLRADIRNVLIWLSTGAPDSPIDGKIDGSYEYSKEATLEDQIAITHENGTLSIKDIFDTKSAKIALECLKSHWNNLLKEIQLLFFVQLDQAKNFLLSEVRSLIPSFLLPFFSKQIMIADGEQQEGDVLGSNAELSQNQELKLEQEKGSEKPEDAIGSWIVDHVVQELKVNTVQNEKSEKQSRARSRSKVEKPVLPGCEWIKDRLSSV